MLGAEPVVACQCRKRGAHWQSRWGGARPARRETDVLVVVARQTTDEREHRGGVERGGRASGRLAGSEAQ
jgi:hypothetical protein